MFEWTPKRIEWYERAIKWTGYDKAMAGALRPYIDNGDNVCDLGCGTGYLGLELARQGYKVSAVDICNEAMECLKRSAPTVPEIEIMLNDWADIGERRWDNVIMCQTGNFDTELSYYLSLCRKKLIVIGKSSSRRWHPDECFAIVDRSKISELSEIFGANGLRYTFKEFSAELGQPFKSVEEAEEYLSCYNIEGEAYIKALKSMELTEDVLYPYYLPYKKVTGIWVIDKT